MEHDKIKLPSSPFENHSTKVHNSLSILSVTNQSPYSYVNWQSPYPFILFFFLYWNFKIRVGSNPYRIDSHVTFLVPRRQTKQSLPLWRAVHLYHWTCLLALSCPLLWSLHVPIARHPKHFYLYLPSSSSSILLLLLPHPKAPSTQCTSSNMRLNASQVYPGSPPPSSPLLLSFCLSPTHAALPHTTITAYLNVLLQDTPMQQTIRPIENMLT